MSKWNEKFNNHGFWTTWNSLKESLNNENLISHDDSVLQDIARVKKVVGFIDGLLEQIDPELMNLAVLDNYNQAASNCLSEINAYLANKNAVHLTNANTQIDSFLTLLSRIPNISFANQKFSLKKASSAYSESIDKYLLKVKSFIEEEIELQKTNLAELLSLLASTKKEIDLLKAQVKNVEQTINKQSAEFNTQFQNNENSRNERFNTLEQKLDSKVDTIVMKHQSDVDEEFKDLSIKSAKIIQILNKYNDDAAKIFGVVTNTLQAGAYSSYANEEKKSANLLRRSAIVLMLIGVGILVMPELIKIYHNQQNYYLDWKSVLGRIPFSLILFVPAFYLARESNKHRNTEIVNRRRELILSTIDPYLALLNDEKAQQIKLEIAKEIFSEGSLAGQNDSSLGEASNLVSQIANMAKQLRNK